MKNKERVFKMSFASIYPHYIAKAKKKGRTKSEVDQIIYWLTGYDEKGFQNQLESNTNLEDFFGAAPHINPNANMIKGMICGYRVEELEDELVRNIRYLDKMIDELARGKAIEKILRK